MDSINNSENTEKTENKQDVQATRQLWDEAAAHFDDEPDHGLRDPLIREAWRDLLAQWLPSPPRRVLDIGCGTGSLSMLMAEMDHEVTGIDFSSAMIVRAQAKAIAAGLQVNLHVMDAAHPHFTQRFDVILCRHLLWALPEPAQVLQRWEKLLAPEGRLILIEGLWHTGAGLPAQSVVNALPASLQNITLHPLSNRAPLWGGAVSDERFAVIAHSAQQNGL